MKDIYNRAWIMEHAHKIIHQYEPGVLTLRALYYRLVAAYGLTNSMRHYKRVVAALTDARKNYEVDYDTFSDHDRPIIGSTEYEQTTPERAANQTIYSIEVWLERYNKNRWENQENYVEVWIEKKALQGAFESVCNDNDVLLAPCKGYPSLTFLYEASQRFIDAYQEAKNLIILYFGDYDPSGEDIPRNIQATLRDHLDVRVDVRRVALMEEQVLEWDLPPAPAKTTDSRTANWDGLGQVELDAVEPGELRQLCQDAIDSVFDEALFEELKETEAEEKEVYQDKVDEFMKNWSKE